MSLSSLDQNDLHDLHDLHDLVTEYEAVPPRRSRVRGLITFAVVVALTAVAVSGAIWLLTTVARALIA